MTLENAFLYQFIPDVVPDGSGRLTWLGELAHNPCPSCNVNFASFGAFSEGSKLEE